MKTILTLLTISVLALLTGCENPMSFKTVVHENGAIDKTITLEKTEKGKAAENIFGIGELNHWQTVSERVESDKDKNKYRIIFTKHFNSVQAVNTELDQPVDTLFQVYASFEKKFRWFYTYIHYSETIRPVNRFTSLSPDDFFNQEDHSFIERLPGEGTPISKADSVFLEVLNEKISDRFANMAMYYEINQIVKDVIIRNNLDKQWLDTLEKKADLVYSIVEHDRGERNLAEKIADSLMIPLPKPQASEDFKALTKNFDARINFMSFANQGKYRNEIHLPWEVVKTNADSIAGNIVIWKPLSTKFAFRDYTMYAECRKMNIWAVATSAGIILLTLILFVRKSTISG